MADITRRADAVWTGNLVEGNGEFSVGSGAIETQGVTWAARTEEPEGKTSPEELIAAAHASCYAMALSHTLTEAGHPPTQLEVSAVVTFAPKPGGGMMVASSALTVRGTVDGLDADASPTLPARASRAAQSPTRCATTSRSRSTPRSRANGAGGKAGNPRGVIPKRSEESKDVGRSPRPLDSSPAARNDTSGQPVRATRPRNGGEASVNTANWPGAADLEAALERLLDAIDQARGPEVAAALAEVDRLTANLDRTVPARLRHFMAQRAYQKALAALRGEATEGHRPG